ncbi:molybdopterin-dependent oxidoreductase, partial [Enterobacter hormaechei]|nr:molybdopterin-dependent oxidoreductase [Enterobacter hormaechei]
LAMDGVAGVWWARDVPGHNEVGPILNGETLFAEDIVDHEGRVIAVVAARDFETAYRAAKKVKVDIEPLEPVLDIAEAHRRRSYVLPPQEVIDGDAATAIAGAPHILSGTLHMGGQDHFYLETQIAYAIPGENGEMLVHSSTQHPT